jgi:TPP-dependent pyruvate/acetoin dehydrogenase alpha subunit
MAERLRLDGLMEDDVAALRQAALDEVAAGLAEAETAPAPDPATLEQGVYATPLW